MGFVERLRQEKISEALKRQQQAEQLKQQRETAEKARFQAEAIEKERRAQRKQQAGIFREESGVDLLVAELRRVLNPWEFGSSYPSIPPTNQDSIFDMAIWDSKDLGRRSEGNKSWMEAEQKFLAVETRPDGNLVFHAGWLGGTTIKLAEWRTNKDILDKALEKAFYNPRIHKFQHSPYETWHESS